MSCLSPCARSNCSGELQTLATSDHRCLLTIRLIHLSRDPQSLADQLTRIPPFVVVPAHHLDQIAIDDLRHAEIHDRGARILDDVGRDDRIPGHAEDSAIPFALGFLGNTRFTSSTVVGLAVSDTMSASDPTGTGARTATPSNLPRYSGSALAVAAAAPVEVGTRFAAPARPLRGGVCGVRRSPGWRCRREPWS